MRQIFGLVPDKLDGLLQYVADGIKRVVVAIGPGKNDDSKFHAVAAPCSIAGTYILAHTRVLPIRFWWNLGLLNLNSEANWYPSKSRGVQAGFATHHVGRGKGSAIRFPKLNFNVIPRHDGKHGRIKPIAHDLEPQDVAIMFGGGDDVRNDEMRTSRLALCGDSNLWFGHASASSIGD
jgi:hypothetical protein